MVKKSYFGKLKSETYLAVVLIFDSEIVTLFHHRLIDIDGTRVER